MLLHITLLLHFLILTAGHREGQSVCIQNTNSTPTVFKLDTFAELSLKLYISRKLDWLKRKQQTVATAVADQYFQQYYCYMTTYMSRYLVLSCKIREWQPIWEFLHKMCKMFYKFCTGYTSLVGWLCRC